MRARPAPSPPSLEKASLLYTYVRGLQLEGRYPRDVGLAPITPMRVRMFWGNVPWRYWPLRGGDPFPPPEPPGIDKIARRLRIDTYQRMRGSLDAATAIVYGSYGVTATVRVTRAWQVGGTDGSIRMPGSGDEFVGEHAVLLTGYENGRFRFDNSWGDGWGDSGRGWLPFEYLDRYGVGAFLPFHSSPPAPADRGDGVRYVTRTPLGHVLRTVRFDDMSTRDRAAWAIAVERDGFLDVEELFVMPQSRRQGYARRLARSLLGESADAGLPMRAWIPESDADRAGIAGVRKVVEMLQLELMPSAMPWARFIATPKV